MLRTRLRYHIYGASNAFLSILFITTEFQIYTQHYGLHKYFDQSVFDVNIAYIWIV